MFINAEACVENLLEILQEWDKRFANLVRMAEESVFTDKKVSVTWNKVCNLVEVEEMFHNKEM